MHQPLPGLHRFGAHSREEALEAVRHKLADVVILDVTKPGLDGFGTLEELRRFSDIPVIILTDLGDEDQAVRGLLLGADDYITKPLNLRDLWGRVRAGHHVLRLAAGQWASMPVVLKTPAVPEGWMTPLEAARVLGRSRQSVHQLIRRGLLSAREIAPRRVVVEQASVLRYLRGRPGRPRKGHGAGTR